MGQGCCSQISDRFLHEDGSYSRARHVSGQGLVNGQDRELPKAVIKTDDDFVNEIINSWHSAEIIYLQVRFRRRDHVCSARLMKFSAAYSIVFLTG
jgi:hypothetical protein